MYGVSSREYNTLMQHGTEIMKAETYLRNRLNSPANMPPDAINLGQGFMSKLMQNVGDRITVPGAKTLNTPQTGTLLIGSGTPLKRL